MRKIKTLLATLIIIVAIDLGVSIYSFKKELDTRSRVEMIEGVQDSMLENLF